jgi:hypothetical protein
MMLGKDGAPDTRLSLPFVVGPKGRIARLSVSVTK